MSIDIPFTFAVLILFFFPGLINHLRVHVKPMYNLWEILKGRDESPMSEEINIACGKTQLDGKAEAEYLKKLQDKSGNIKKAFEDQKARAAVIIFSLLVCSQLT